MCPIAEAATAALDISNAWILVGNSASKGIHDWDVGGQWNGKQFNRKA